MADVPPVSAREELSEAVMLLKRFRKALDVSFGDDATWKHYVANSLVAGYRDELIEKAGD